MADTSFFTDSEALVQDALQGLCRTSSELVLNLNSKTISRSAHNPSKHVTLISGGGAGHEPAHAAFVGQGMLSAAVSGYVSASPSVSRIVEAIHSVGGTAGTILIIKNYTGDIFHFNLAAEKARARWGHRVEVLVVGDDVAVGRQRSGKVGRRGLAGAVLVHKILGALSAKGKSIDELLAVGQQVIENLVTCGVSQGHVNIPGTAHQKGLVQLELGMGIHNEPGLYVLDPRPTLDGLLDRMLELLTRRDDEDRAYLNFEGETPVLLLNNLGGTSQLEFTAILHHLLERLGKQNLQPVRILAGTFMTSLDASGFSVTLLKATPEMLDAIDDVTTAVGWPRSIANPAAINGKQVVNSKQEMSPKPLSESTGPKIDPHSFTTAIRAACQSLLAAEPSITQSDRIVGDGDCGTTLSRGANAILKALSESPLTPSTSASAAVMRIALALERSIDGTSGALYELFVTALAAALQTAPEETATLETWAKAAGVALTRLQAMTPARVGDRTLMDALTPYVEALAKGDVEQAVEAARRGCESTRGMEASLGRAVYVAGENWDKVADPGAEGIVAILSLQSGQ
ncbi:dihydroxyacetone kinase [Dactylonectria macrodidyma]|uniref:Dihydroxyacetone kinase n=1 Tax=Dactylonectria macrodidyma TaxID=307937 RepID=A0A9P9F8Z6_9HYPO|nr:dihydroxyacetone kinase [Dactylonectria macrodidyma]